MMIVEGYDLVYLEEHRVNFSCSWVNHQFATKFETHQLKNKA